MVDREWKDLWPDGAPGAQGSEPADRPALQIFLPKKVSANGASMVVCPGGGYHHLAPHEGAPIAEWLNSSGITAFVLRYRLAPKYHYPCQLDDVRRAIRFVRANAADWKLDPERIGVLGFSAGGHLASTASTHFTFGDSASTDAIERVSSRPTAQILIYPLITFGEHGHAESRNGFLGGNTSAELIERFSNEKQVTKQTPPAFLVHSLDDTVVKAENCDNYSLSLRAAGVPYEYMRESLGPHGFGLKDAWTVPCMRWLKCWLLDP